MSTNGTQAQIDAALHVVESVLGAKVFALYLFGSAVAGGLTPHSDLDLLVLVHEPTTADERSRLVAALRPISRRGDRPADWRPIELTAVAMSDLDRLTTPRTDFQYGEWLREDFDAGRFDPAEPNNPDLLVLLAQVWASGRALRGPQARAALPEIPPADLKRAMLDTLDSLHEDLATDTTNVLLTLARIWHTLESGKFGTKDAAAAWAADRMSPAGDALRRAAEIHRGEMPDEWATGEADQAARELIEQIRG